MYLGFYGMKEEPFGVTPDPRFLYPTPAHREAFASLAYGIEAGRGFMALTAEAGMGKTTLLFQLLERLRGSAYSALVFHTQCGPEQLLRYVLNDMGVETNGHDLVQMHSQLNNELIRIHQSGKAFVAVIDEAQNLSNEALESVRLLSDFETPRSKLMQIVLSGQPQLAEKLSDPALVQLRQRISMICKLSPLMPEEVDGYIQHRLSVAGHKGGPLFTPEARALIASASKGIPRNINNLCFNALSLGYALSRKKIDAGMIREVLSDLDLRPLTPTQETKARVPVVRLTNPNTGPEHRSRGKLIRGQKWLGGAFAAAALCTCIIFASSSSGRDFYCWITDCDTLAQAGSTAAPATYEQIGLPPQSLKAKDRVHLVKHHPSTRFRRTQHKKLSGNYANVSMTSEARPRTGSSGAPPQTPSGSGISPVRGEIASKSTEHIKAQTETSARNQENADRKILADTVGGQNCQAAGSLSALDAQGSTALGPTKPPISEAAFMQFRDLPAQGKTGSDKQSMPCPRGSLQPGPRFSETPETASTGRQTQAKP